MEDKMKLFYLNLLKELEGNCLAVLTLISTILLKCCQVPITFFSKKVMRNNFSFTIFTGKFPIKRQSIGTQCMNSSNLTP